MKPGKFINNSAAVLSGCRKTRQLKNGFRIQAGSPYGTSQNSNDLSHFFLRFSSFSIKDTIDDFIQSFGSMLVTIEYEIFREHRTNYLSFNLAKRIPASFDDAYYTSPAYSGVVTNHFFRYTFPDFICI